MNDLQFEAMFAIMAFASTRYLLPQTMLKKSIVVKEMIVLSVCYGLCAYLRKWARENRSKDDKIL